MSLVCSLDKHPRHWPQINCDHEPKGCNFNRHDCCRDCFDQAKLDSDRLFQEFADETKACPDCQSARHAAFIREQRTQTIDPASRWGAHIVLLCRHHLDDPERYNWSTKNISEGRSIFYFGRGGECSCSGRDLFSPGRFLYKLCYLLGTDNLYTGES